MSTTDARVAVQHWLRDHVIENVPSSGTNEPDKPEGRAALARIMSAIDALEGMVTVSVRWNTNRVRVQALADVDVASGLVAGTTINDVELEEGDVVFLPQQTNTAQNGLWVVPAAGAASRAPWADSAAELAHIAFAVREGTVGAGGAWHLPLDAAGITVGDTPLIFAYVGILPDMEAEVVEARGASASLRLELARIDAKVRIVGTNQFSGDGAGAALTTGTENVGNGEDALGSLTSGERNVADGWGALRAATTASRSTASGREALAGVETGDDNTGDGYRAGASLTGAASRNTHVGSGSGDAAYGPQKVDAVNSSALGAGAVTTRDNQVSLGDEDVTELMFAETPFLRFKEGALTNSFFFGPEGGNHTTTSQCSIGVGGQALASLAGGGHNIGFGYRSLTNGTSIGSNVFIGSFTGEDAIDVIDSVAVGFGALRHATTGLGGVAVGIYALENATNVGNNTAVGDSCFRHTTTGQQNVGMGYTCADSNLTGSYNVYLGQGCAFARTQGDYNFLGGYRAGADAVLAGNRNVGIGTAALLDHVGNDMVAVGQEAARGMTTASSGVIVGAGAAKASDGQKVDAVNVLLLGAGVWTNEDNIAILGNPSIVKTLLRGTVYVNPTAGIAVTSGRMDVQQAKTTAGNPTQGLVITDTAAAAADVGGCLTFRGCYTGTTVTEAAAIQALKSNGTSGQYGFDLAFHTRDNGGTNTRKVTIKSGTGNVGVGTSAPSEKLHVAGNLKLTGVIRFGPLTVATLPVVANEGDFTQVSDASAPSWRTPPTGGGTEYLNVIYSGGQWLAA